MYDLICSICGYQLHYKELKDTKGYTLIVVDPCPVCTDEMANTEVSAGQKVED